MREYWDTRKTVIFNRVLQVWILTIIIWAPSSEFVSSSTPSWQILTAHAQPFRGARDLVFCLKVPLDSLLVWASSGGSGETARMRRLVWTFAARIGYKYQIRLTRSILCSLQLGRCNTYMYELNKVSNTHKNLRYQRLVDTCICLITLLKSTDRQNVVLGSHEPCRLFRYGAFTKFHKTAIKW